MNNQSLTDALAERQTLERRYNGARNNLLLVVVFSAVNVILSVLNSFSYFLFSASVPYMLADLGRYLCGRYPEEYYEDAEVYEFFPDTVFWVMIAISAVIIAMYLLAYIFSKKNRVGWLIFALVFFALDTVTMFLYFGISVDILMDIVFHIWVLVSLFMGVFSHYKLKKLPPVLEPEAEPAAVTEENEQITTTEEN